MKVSGARDWRVKVRRGDVEESELLQRGDNRERPRRQKGRR